MAQSNAHLATNGNQNGLAQLTGSQSSSSQGNMAPPDSRFGFRPTSIPSGNLLQQQSQSQKKPMTAGTTDDLAGSMSTKGRANVASPLRHHSIGGFSPAALASITGNANIGSLLNAAALGQFTGSLPLGQPSHSLLTNTLTQSLGGTLAPGLTQVTPTLSASSNNALNLQQIQSLQQQLQQAQQMQVQRVISHVPISRGLVLL